jgi:phosphate starvation-inducible PhoH-like protein
MVSSSPSWVSCPSRRIPVSKEPFLIPTVKIVLDDPDFLGQLCGAGSSNLDALEAVVGAPVFALGNEVHLRSEDRAAFDRFDLLIRTLRQHHAQGQAVTPDLITSLEEALVTGDETKLQQFQDTAIVIPQGFGKVFPRGWHQVEYVDAMRRCDVTFGIGPAGTGKTYLAIAQALSEVLSKKRRKIILTRPVVEAGENLGFLPGDLAQKISPYLRPLYDAMEDLIPAEILNRLEENRVIEIAPLAYMRGRSLKNCFVVLDEAQNTTKTQMKMFLTRLGEGAKAVITGDQTQVDLPRTQESGLHHARKILEGIPEVHFSVFEKKDVVRSDLVRKIIEAYEKHEG